MAKGKKNRTGIKNVERNVRKAVEEEELIVCISVSQKSIKIEGSSNIVKIFEDSEKLEDITLKEFLQTCRTEKSSQKYTAFHPTIFPPLTAKFKDKSTWTWKHARDNLTTYLVCLGYGKGKQALKSYKDPKFKPCWWPSSDSDARLQWENFRGPSYVDTDCNNLILEHLFPHFNINPDTFYVKNVAAETTQGKNRRKKKKSRRLIDNSDDDDNDTQPPVDKAFEAIQRNEDYEEDDFEDINYSESSDDAEDLTKNQEKSGCSSSETLSEESSSDEETHKKKRKVTFASPPDSTEMSEYEKERNQRVAERQAEEFELFGFVVR